MPVKGDLWGLPEIDTRIKENNEKKLIRKRGRNNFKR